MSSHLINFSTHYSLASTSHHSIKTTFLPASSQLAGSGAPLSLVIPLDFYATFDTVDQLVLIETLSFLSLFYFTGSCPSQLSPWASFGVSSRPLMLPFWGFYWCAAHIAQCSSFFRQPPLASPPPPPPGCPWSSLAPDFWAELLTS